MTAIDKESRHVIIDEEMKEQAPAHNVLDGAMINDVLKCLQTGGFTQDGHTYNDRTYYSVNWMMLLLCKVQYLKGQLKLGLREIR